MPNKAKMKRLALRQQQRRSAADATRSAPSQPKASAPSRWHAAPAVDRENAERVDGMAPMRNALRHIARDRGEWAGIPMPLDNETLVIEPTYPFADGLSKIGAPKRAAEEDDGSRLRNSFYSWHRRCDVLIVQMPDGRIDWGVQPAVHHIKHDLATLGCADAWGIEQETNALDLLASMLRARQFRQYLLTGMFLESSPRSGVTYLFRRLKPTVAIRTDHAKNTTRILCALCLHPIAYYSGSWAGAMCPTDDVVAHLALMRGDEAMFWRRSNQHPAWRPEAGL